MFTDNFSRYEFKFPVTCSVMNAMLEDLSPFVEKDPYGNKAGYYCLSSIYFDNSEDQCFHETMNSIEYRQKIRLRVYRDAGDISGPCGVEAVKDAQIGGDEPSYLEIKSKINGLVRKRRAKMKLDDAMRFIKECERQLDAGTDPASVLDPENKEKLAGFNSSSVQILREIQYIILSKKLRPRNVVSYERLALFAKDDPELRITFDINIRTRGDDLDLAAGTAGELSCPEDIAVLEVKTGSEIPFWLVKILGRYGYRNKTFSKYCSYYVDMLPKDSLQKEYVRYQSAENA